MTPTNGFEQPEVKKEGTENKGQRERLGSGASLFTYRFNSIKVNGCTAKGNNTDMKYSPSNEGYS